MVDQKLWFGFFQAVPGLIGCVIYVRSCFNIATDWLTHQRHPFLPAKRGATFSGLSLPRTAASVQDREGNQQLGERDMSRKLNYRVKPRLDFWCLRLCLLTDTLMGEWDVSAHFDYVRCHGLQWDQSRLLHVDLLLIGNYPWKILRRERHKCDTTHAYNKRWLQETHRLLC